MSKYEDSMFTKCPNEPEIPWFQVPRAFIRNPNLSLEAKGLMTYLMSHSDNFEISIPWVIKTQKISKNRIYRIINECIEQGYLLRETYSSHGMKRYRYLISSTGRFKKCLPCPQKQDTEKQDPENGDRKLEQSSSYEEEREEDKPPPPPIFTYKRVKFELSKLYHLEKDFGKEKIAQMLDRLDEYADINPKRFKQYACHAAVIRKWIRDDEEKAPKTGSNAGKTAINKKLAERIVKKYGDLKTGCKMEAGPSALEFSTYSHSTGTHYFSVHYSENGFRDQVLSRLLKMGLSIDGIDT